MVRVYRAVTNKDKVTIFFEEGSGAARQIKVWKSDLPDLINQLYNEWAKIKAEEKKEGEAK